MRSLTLFLAAIVGCTVLSCDTAKISRQKTAASFTIPCEKFVLDNGLEVILHEDHSDPIVAVATVVHVGSNREKPGMTGFAHFFEHMSFNDSENTPRGANRKLIPEWGGVRNGGTWSDGTIYYEVVPKDAFDKILWIDSDRLGFMINTVTAAALEREKQVVKNEKRERVDNSPYGFTEEIIRTNLYPADHPYHWTVIGSLPDLQAATLDDVKIFYDQYYGAGNATLVIAGDIDIDETKEKVKYWFDEIRQGPEVKPLPPMPVNLVAVKSFYFEDNFAKLPELRMVFPSIQLHHKDEYALRVLSELLAGSKKAPLYEVIVEQKKQAPSAAVYQSGNELAGEFVIRVRGNAGMDLDEIKQSIETALARFETEGFTDTELQQIKAQIETRLYASIETVLDKAYQMAIDNEFAGDPVFVLKAAELTQAVTRDDVMRVYNQYIRNKPYVMTSVVPKGQADLAIKDAMKAEVYEEEVVADIKAEEEVSQGEEAQVEKTVTKHDRSEPPFLAPPLFRSPPVWNAALANGMKIYGIENTEIPLVTFDITIPGGHYLDPPAKAGVASLMADLMMQGTANKTPAELEEAIDLLGARISIHCGNEEIRIRATCLARNFESTLALVAEVLLQPRWDEAEYIRLKKALENNLKGRAANPAALASINFTKLLYTPEHILGYPVNGTLETTSRITLQDLKHYYAAHMSPSQASFHVVGAVDAVRIQASLKPLEHTWPAKEVQMPTYALPEQKPEGTVYFIDVPGAKQSVLYIGKLALSNHDPNASKLEFANEILGGGSSGRLFQTLRIEKGYTYGAYSRIHKLSAIAPFVVATSVRANATRSSLQIIQDMLRDYAATFSEKDVEVVKNKVLKYNTLAYESQSEKLSMLWEMSKYGKSPDYVELQQQELLSMELSDFKKVIQTYLDEAGMIYVIAGDKATQLAGVTAFATGRVVLIDNDRVPVE